MIFIVTGDSATTLTVPCVDADGITPLDLTGATVKLKWQVDGGAIQTRDMTISSPATAGVATYTLAAADFPSPGSMSYCVQITYAGGAVLTSRTYDDVTIEKALA